MGTARKLVNQLLAASPLVAMAAIGIHARTFSDGFTPPTSSAAWDADLLAYSDLVRQTEELGEDGLTVAEAERLSDRWLVAYRGGELRNLPPAFFGDDALEGVRGQVVRAHVAVNRTLLRASMAAMQEGKAEEVARLSIRVVRHAEITKHFDPATCASSLRAQRRALADLEPMLPFLGEPTRRRLGRELAELARVQRPLEPVARLQQQQFLAHRSQMGKPASPIETGTWTELRFAANRELAAEAQAVPPRLRQLPDAADEMMPIAHMVAAIEVNEDFQRRLRRMRAALDAPRG